MTQLNFLIAEEDAPEIDISGLTYVPDFITPAEHDFLLSQIDQQPWLTDLKRRVQHYGYKYDYKARTVGNDAYLGSLPDWLLSISKKLHDDGIFPSIPDQVIVNEYLPGQAEREIANIMKAIKAGIVTPTTKSELERAEADLQAARTALDDAKNISEMLTTVLPDAGGCYRALVKKLEQTLYTDVPYARQCLKAALGLVRLVPSAAGSYLEAELRHNPEGLMLLALKKSEGLKVRMVVR